jgi:hypothetical protein
MINIKSGKFFYRLTTEKNANYKEELLNFLSSRGVSEKELQKANGIDFNSAIGSAVTVKHVRFDLNIKVAETEIILLFGGQMDSNEFNDFVEGFFK